MAEAAQHGGRRLRIGFPMGFWMGFLVCVVCGVVLFGRDWGGTNDSAPDQTNALQVRANGSVLSDRGIGKLTLKDPYDSVTLVCRGACDDLRVENMDSQYGGYDMALFDVHGTQIDAVWLTTAKPHQPMTVALAGGGLVKVVPAFD